MVWYNPNRSYGEYTLIYLQDIRSESSAIRVLCRDGEFLVFDGLAQHLIQKCRNTLLRRHILFVVHCIYSTICLMSNLTKLVFSMINLVFILVSSVCQLVHNSRISKLMFMFMTERRSFILHSVSAIFFYHA